MITDIERRDLAHAVCAALERCCPGSSARLRGSLAAGTADEYSDIDVRWDVPDAAFPGCLADGERALAEVWPVESVRSAPDFHRSDRRRLVFVRFAELPLFWRLDLDVRARSVAEDDGYDVDNPRAQARDGEWSRPASAAANAVGAVKAVARGRVEDARGLLDRGFARIGEDDHATGRWVDDVGRLARAAARGDPTLEGLAERIVALATRQLSRVRTSDDDGPGR